MFVFSSPVFHRILDFYTRPHFHAAFIFKALAQMQTETLAEIF